MILFQTPPLISGWQLLTGLLGLILVVGSAVIVLLATRKTTVSSVQIQRAEASEALVKTRDQQLIDCDKKCQKCREELEDTTTELRAQMGLNVGELMDWAQTRTRELAKMANLEQENRVLHVRLGDMKE
jgi:hypothetical protein